MSFAASDLEIGDFILCHRKGLASGCIRLGQKLRFGGKDAFWSHAALIVSPDGDLIEALTKGICKGHISEYKDIEYTIVKTHTQPLDQEQILYFASRVLGEKYGWMTILCCAIGLLTGGKFTFGFSGQSICSGLIARAQERSGAVFDKDATDIMPADLARYYSVQSP